MQTMLHIISKILIGGLMLFPSYIIASVPDATIYGPIVTEPHPSLNSIYSASAIELINKGYIEDCLLYTSPSPRDS